MNSISAENEIQMVNYKKRGLISLVVRKIQTNREIKSILYSPDCQGGGGSLTIPSVGTNVEKWELLYMSLMGK